MNTYAALLTYLKINCRILPFIVSIVIDIPGKYFDICIWFIHFLNGFPCLLISFFLIVSFWCCGKRYQMGSKQVNFNVIDNYLGPSNSFLYPPFSIFAYFSKNLLLQWMIWIQFPSIGWWLNIIKPEQHFRPHW